MKNKAQMVLCMAMLLMATMLVACGGDDSDDMEPRLVGNWSMTKVGGGMSVGYQYFNDQEIIYQFKSDGTLVVTNHGDQVPLLPNGTYSYICGEKDDNNMSLTIKGITYYLSFHDEIMTMAEPGAEYDAGKIFTFHK